MHLVTVDHKELRLTEISRSNILMGRGHVPFLYKSSDQVFAWVVFVYHKPFCNALCAEMSVLLYLICRTTANVFCPPYPVGQQPANGCSQVCFNHAQWTTNLTSVTKELLWTLYLSHNAPLAPGSSSAISLFSSLSIFSLLFPSVVPKSALLREQWVPN